MQQVTVEDEKQLLSIKGRLEKIKSTKIYHDMLVVKKEKLTDVLSNLILPLGRSISSIQRSKLKIDGGLTDPLTEHLYKQDNLYREFENYMEHSDTRHLIQQQWINVLTDFITESMPLINDDIKTAPPREPSKLDDGTPLMDEDERERFKKIAHAIIQNYKNESRAAGKNVLASRLLTLANTKEKILIADNLFLDVVGEKILEKKLSKIERIKKQGGTNRTDKHPDFGRDTQSTE